MNQSNDVILDLHNNPGKIQSRILQDQQARVTGGKAVIDGNNVVSHVIESFSVISSDIVKSTINEFDTLYPKRAQTVEQLYKHMSDFDYVNLYSTPSSMYVELILEKKQLLENAVSFNDNYKKVLIPRETVITIDRYNFSLYYPIEIRINKATGTFIVSYDTTNINPLQSLQQNTIEHRLLNFRGIEVVSILLPVHQFVRTPIIEDVTPAISFVKKYPFTEKFYAARVYTSTAVEGEWLELRQTLSDSVYDPDSPTAKLLVDDEFKTLTVTIPQVYLTNKLIGNRVKVEILTTYGEVDVDLSAVQQEAISAVFTLSGNADADQYTAILTRPQVIIVNPASEKLIGGSNGIDFEHLRQRVIHDSFTDSVLLTPTDLTNYFADKGFRISKYQDGITNRIYLCHKEITDQQGIVAPSANLRTEFKKTDLQSIATVNSNVDGSFTILPTTVYKYDDSSQSAIPLTDAEVAILTNLTREESIIAYNTNTYVNNPFHVRIDVNDRYPMAYTYDMTAPIISNVEFVGENINISSQLSLYHMTVDHDIKGVGGYHLELHVQKTTDLKDLVPADTRVVITAKSSSKVTVYQEGIYDRTEEGRDIYKIHLTSNYSITRHHHVEMTSLKDLLESDGHHIPLESIFNIAFYVRTSEIAVPPGSTTDIAQSLDGRYPDFTPVAEQSAKILFGTRVDEAFSNVDLLYTAEEYEEYASKEFATYPRDEYAKDGDGKISYVTQPSGIITLDIAHNQGSRFVTAQQVLLSPDADSDFYVNNYFNAFLADEDILLDGTNIEDYVGTTQWLKVPTDRYVERSVALTTSNEADFYGALIDEGGSDIVLDATTILPYIDTTVVLKVSDSVVLELEIAIDNDNKADYVGSTLIVTLDADNAALFVNTIQNLLIPTLLHEIGDPKFDNNGNRVKLTDREIIFSINMIQIGAKLGLSEQPVHVEFYQSTIDLLRSYFAAVKTSRGLLIEETEIYFQSMRSLGTSQFKQGANQLITIDLEMEIKLKVYVFNHIMESLKSTDTIKETVISIIDQTVETGTFSATAVADNIREQMPSMVKHVDVLGINEQPLLQTLINTDPTVIPHLKQELFLDDDGSIAIRRSLEIEFVSIGVE